MSEKRKTVGYTNDLRGLTKDLRSGAALVAVVLGCAGASAGAVACSSSSASDGSGVGSTDGGRPADAATALGDAGWTETGSREVPTPDATPHDEGGASEAGPPSLCPGSSFLFCDGFEQGLTNWTSVASTGGGVSVDSVHVHRGTKALHANVYAVTEAGATAYAMVQKYGPQPWPTHFFTRFFAYVPSPDPPTTAGLLDLIENGAPYSGTELRLSPPRDAIGMQTYGTDAGLVTWQSTQALATLDQWTCFEVEVDTLAETEHVYVNDDEVTDLMRSGLTLPQLGNTSVGLSFFRANVQNAVDAWIDEVAVDSARIGCAN
ncbi:MAG TPA: hypothetical protein VF765_23845 [Polyangiaceae bacterium]